MMDMPRIEGHPDEANGLAVSGSAAAPILEVSGITKAYGHVVALKDVSLELHAGEIHALVGDNGAGKSTLVKIVAGAIQADRGEIMVRGRSMQFHKPDDAFAAGIATVHQNLALVGARSIAENLFLGSEPTRFGVVRARQMRSESLAILRQLDQQNITNPGSLVAELSGGQRQAVALARAVSQERPVVILDEPTAALGVRESERTLEMILQMRSTHRTVLLISHNLQHVFRVADRITVFRSGFAVGTVHAAHTNPDGIIGMITGLKVEQALA